MMTSFWEVPSSSWPRSSTSGSSSLFAITPEDIADIALGHLLDFDKSLETVDAEMKKLRRQMEQNLRQQRPSSRTLTGIATRPGNLLEHRTFSNPIKTTPDGSRTLKIAFDLHDFKPEEVKVTVDSKKNCVRIEADHEVKDEKARFAVCRNYRREFYVPDEAKVEDVSKLELKSQMTNEGMLWVEAPLPKLPKEEARREKAEETVRGNEPTPIEIRKI